MPYTVGGSLDIATYWCCLNPAERNILIAVSTYLVSVPPAIPKVTYDALWLASGANSALKRADALISIYGLTLGEIPISETETIEAYFLTGDFWPVCFGWVAEGHALCSAQCSLLTFPL